MALFLLCFFLGATIVSSEGFGAGSGPIFPDDISCNGNENEILDCSFEVDTSDCSHSDDAEVRCQTRCELNK